VEYRCLVRHVAFFGLTLILASLPALSAGAPGDAKDAGAPATDAGSADAAARRIPPDPPAMSERFQWVYDLRWDRGDPYLNYVHKVDMGAPHTTPRVMGRFAIELYEGPTLIERVRFDFPMLGAPEVTDAGFRTPPQFEPKLRTRIGVFFPATTRGTKLELWDRASDKRWPLPWPPKEGPVTPGNPDGRSNSAEAR